MTKYLSYIFAVVLFCYSCFGEDIDSGWNNFKNSLLNDMSSMYTSFGVVSATYDGIEGSLDTIIREAGYLSSDDSLIKNIIINNALSAKQSLYQNRGAINSLREDVSSMRSTIYNMDYPSSSSGGSSSVDPSITNDLQSIISHLSNIERYDTYIQAKIQELIQTNRPIRDNISNLLYRVEHNIISSMGTIQAYTVSMAQTASNILTSLSSIQTYLDSSNTYLLHIRNNSNILVNELRAFVTSWNNHADHQDTFYDNTIILLRHIGGDLHRFATNSNYNIDFSNISGLITNVNLTSYIGIKEFYQSLSDSILTYPYPKTSYGRPNGQLGFSTSSISALGSILPQILSNDGSYNPFLLSVWLQSVLAVNTSTLNSWQYLLNTNLVDLVQSSGVISGTLKDIDTDTQNLVIGLHTNNFLLGQQLLKFDQFQDFLSNNTSVATLNHASWDWHTFFTNYYLYASLGPENYNITNQGVSSSWHDHTNWFNRVEALIAALVFPPIDNFNTNGVSSSVSVLKSELDQTLNRVTEFTQKPDELLNSVQNSGNNLIQTIQAFNTQIQQASDLPDIFTLFSVDHIETGEPGTVSGGDWSIYTSMDNTPFSRFADFVRLLFTICWITLFLYITLVQGKRLLYIFYKLIMFVFNVYSTMMGG